MSGQSVRSAAVEKAAPPKAVEVARSYLPTFANVLPDHVDAKSFVGQAVATLRRDPSLLEAANNSPDVLVNVLLTCASLGHSPGSKEFYLTARRSSDHGGKTVIVGLEGYRGVVERMYRSGAVAAVIVREVRAKDKFEFVEGVQDAPYHEIDWFGGNEARGPLVGVYAYARLASGATSRVVVLNREQVEEAKQKSDLGKQNKGPWVTNELAMWLKTAAHRLEPWVPTSAEYRRELMRAQAAASEHAAPGGPPPGVDPATGEITDDIVDADVVEDQPGGGGDPS